MPGQIQAAMTEKGAMVLTDTHAEQNLPRYFANVFATARTINTGRLDFVLPDGRVFRAQGPKAGPIGIVHIHNDDCFARLVREGYLGFCDAYLDGWWSTPDLSALMDFVHMDNESLYNGFPGMGLVRAFERLRHWLRGNSKNQARKNIAFHYDLGNDFYRLWLDDTMTYSAAIFATGQEDLEKAQIAKYASMVDQMGVAPGDHVLEIGCGWGGFAEYAARERGLKVTGLTISEEQFNYAKERIENAGLSDMVELKLQDYRDERGHYDGIASIEMFEAVGEKYWPVYFATLHDRLRPGRQATLQVITVEDHRFESYRKDVDFIQKYIFPGGLLPSSAKLREHSDRAGLRVSHEIDFGPSYALTLRRWFENFNDRWAEIAAMGFDDRFRRMWNFYLTSCASAFMVGQCNVIQITIEKPS